MSQITEHNLDDVLDTLRYAELCRAEDSMKSASSAIDARAAAQLTAVSIQVLITVVLLAASHLYIDFGCLQAIALLTLALSIRFVHKASKLRDYGVPVDDVSTIASLIDETESDRDYTTEQWMTRKRSRYLRYLVTQLRSRENKGRANNAEKSELVESARLWIMVTFGLDLLTVIIYLLPLTHWYLYSPVR